MDNRSVYNGLMAGGITVLIYLVTYLIRPEAMLGQVLSWGTLMIYLFFMYRSVAEERDRLNGAIVFVDALKTAFVTYVVAAVIFYAFYYIMFNLVDPQLEEMSRQMAMEGVEKMGFIPDDLKEEMFEEIQNQEFMSFTQALIALGSSIFGGLILSLIIAAIMKKDPLPDAE